MKLIKDLTSIELVGEISVVNVAHLIRYMINYFQSTVKKEEDWLTSQESLFFIACVIIGNRGLDYNSDEANNIFSEIFHLRRQSDKTNYLSRIQKKGWLSFNKKTKKIILNELFKFDLKKQSFNINVKVKFNDS